VLRLRGAAAVAGGEQPAAVAEDRGELGAPVLDEPGLPLEIRQGTPQLREVPVEDPGAVRDFDTPEDYARFFGRPPSAKGG